MEDVNYLMLTIQTHQENAWGQIKGVQALQTPWSLSATPHWNHCYETPHQIHPKLGHIVLKGMSPPCNPLPGKDNKAIPFYFTQNSVSEIWFGTGTQRPSFQHHGVNTKRIQDSLDLATGWHQLEQFQLSYRPEPKTALGRWAHEKYENAVRMQTISVLIVKEETDSRISRETVGTEEFFGVFFPFFLPFSLPPFLK